MTVVNTVTGEIVEYDRAAAERRAERITLRLDAIAENYTRVLPMIREAIEKRDDIALGYRSPGEYVADRFGHSLSNLGVEVRREVVRELTAAGMSTRAIAPVVGVSDRMVRKDVASGGNPVPTSPTPAAEPTPDSEMTGPAEGAREGVVDTVRPPVTGIDGKTYSVKPKKAVARDDAEIYLNQIESLAAKAARETQNLTPDQIRRVRPKADLWTVGLRKSIEALQRLVDSLETKENK